VKKFLLFIMLLSLFGCGSNVFKSKKSISINCPPVLFAKEHKVYMDSLSEKISLDNISFRAEINNAIFKKGCTQSDNVFSTDLSLLFVVKPMMENQQNINLPFYIAILDKDKKLQDIQYYSINSIFKKNIETKLLVESEIFTTKNINFYSKGAPITMVVGFMLDKNRLELLN